MISSIIQALFKIIIQPDINEQERTNKESMISLTLKTSQSFFVSGILKKVLFKDKGEWRIKQKTKECFLTPLATAI